MYLLIIGFIAIGLLTLNIPSSYKKEFSSITQCGYQDLAFDNSVFEKGSYYNIGQYSLHLRYMSIDIESIQTDNKIVWSNPIEYRVQIFIKFLSQAFLSCQNVEINLDKNKENTIIKNCKQQLITKIQQTGQYQIKIQGTFSDCQDSQFQFTLEETLGIDSQPQLSFSAKCFSDSNFNRIYFRTRSTPFEQLYGFGEESSYLFLKGKIFNFFSKIDGDINNNGDWYMSKQLVMTTYNRSIFIETQNYTLWDLQDEWSINVLVWNSEIKGQIFQAENLNSLLRKVNKKLDLGRNKLQWKTKWASELESRVQKSSKRNLPLIRPVAFEFQNDKFTYDIQDQFMIGNDLMIANISQKQDYKAVVYFPRVYISFEIIQNKQISLKYKTNFWINVWTKEIISGCECYRLIEFSSDKLPIFIKSNSVDQIGILSIFEKNKES